MPAKTIVRLGAHTSSTWWRTITGRLTLVVRARDRVSCAPSRGPAVDGTPDHLATEPRASRHRTLHGTRLAPLVLLTAAGSGRLRSYRRLARPVLTAFLRDRRRRPRLQYERESALRHAGPMSCHRPRDPLATLQSPLP